MACVVYPAAADAAIGETRVQTSIPDTPAHAEPKASDLVAADVREAIVALLLEKRVDVPGRWLDVYVAPDTGNGAAYVIIPARKLRRVLSEELSRLIGRTLSVEEKSWFVRSEEVENILRSSEARLSLS
jgi:hypothetical protein